MNTPESWTERAARWTGLPTNELEAAEVPGWDPTGMQGSGGALIRAATVAGARCRRGEDTGDFHEIPLDDLSWLSQPQRNIDTPARLLLPRLLGLQALGARLLCSELLPHRFGADQGVCLLLPDSKDRWTVCAGLRRYEHFDDTCSELMLAAPGQAGSVLSCAVHGGDPKINGHWSRPGSWLDQAIGHPALDETSARGGPYYREEYAPYAHVARSETGRPFEWKPNHAPRRAQWREELERQSAAFGRHHRGLQPLPSTTHD